MDTTELSDKIKAIKNGQSPIKEEGLGALISEYRNDGKINATHDISFGIKQSEVVIVCVGTPVFDNGSLDLSVLFKVSE